MPFKRSSLTCTGSSRSGASVVRRGYERLCGCEFANAATRSILFTRRTHASEVCVLVSVPVSSQVWTSMRFTRMRLSFL